jgi:hypothetical protein
MGTIQLELSMVPTDAREALFPAATGGVPARAQALAGAVAQGFR